jgi:hypothetical protein
VRTRRLLFVAAMTAIVAYQAWSVFFRPLGIPANPAGSRPLTIGEIAGPRVVSQTFRLGVDGFDSITLDVRPWAAAADGVVTFRFWQQHESAWWLFRPLEPRSLLFEIRRPAQEVTAASRYTLRFSPLESKATVYTLDIEAPATPIGAGIGLLASRDPYRDGQLTVDGRSQWGDLAFSTTATKSTLFLYRAGDARSGLDIARRLAPLIAGLLLLDVALGAIIWWLILEWPRERVAVERWHEQPVRSPV